MSEPLVIVGAGPAGATAAIRLANAGLAPLLIERDSAPRHRVCGEFLSIEAQAALRASGVDPLALGASRITRLRLVHGGRVAEARLPFTAVGLTRYALDAALLERAGAAGARVERGTSVRRIEGGQLILDGGRTIRAACLLLASGKHDVRGARRDAAGTIADLVGFKSYFRLTPAQSEQLSNHIEILMFADGYAGLQLVEKGMANLCLLVRRTKLARAGGRWPNLLAMLASESPHLCTRLDGAVELFDRPLSIANLPYGYLHHPRVADPPKLYRLGDQLAVIPSFSGDGMSIAMHSGAAAAAAVLAGRTAGAYHAACVGDLRRQIILADRLYRLSRPRVVQSLAVAAARLAPGLLRCLATWTRIPDAALIRAGLELG